MKLLLFLFLILLSMNAFSWGKTGHRVVAALAYKHIDHATTKEVNNILGREPIYEAALWPDRIKSDNKIRPQYSKTHYINTDNDLNVSEHLKKYPKNTNIITELERFKNVLKDKKASKEDKKIALRFIVHLIGDLHQPLHVTTKKIQGGKNDTFKWFGKEYNLHAIWDENIIDMEELSFTEWVTMLDTFSRAEIAKAQKGDTVSWAQESQDLVKSAYDMSEIEMKYFHYNYSYRNLDTVHKRLRLAGYRLAHFLNQIF